MKRAALYSRVSTKKEEQTNALEASLVRLRDFASAREFRVTHEFIDRLSGKGEREARPGYSALVESARRRDVDVVLVTRLDRLARSTRELVLLVDDLTKWGVDLVVLDQPIDTTSAMGRFIFTIFAALAALERESTVERVVRGLDTARRRGRRLGRPPSHADLVPRAREMRAAGASLTQVEDAILAQHGVAVTRSWVRRACAERPPVLGSSAPEADLTRRGSVPDRPVSDTPAGGPTP